MCLELWVKFLALELLYEEIETVVVVNAQFD